MSQFTPALTGGQLPQADQEQVQPRYTDILMDELVEREQAVAPPYAETLMDTMGTGRAAGEQMASFLEGMEIQDRERPGLLDMTPMEVALLLGVNSKPVQFLQGMQFLMAGGEIIPEREPFQAPEGGRFAGVFKSLVRDAVLGPLEGIFRFPGTVSRAARTEESLFSAVVEGASDLAGDALEWMREAPALAADPRAIVEGTDFASVGEALRNPVWWSDQFPGLVGNAVTFLFPGLVATKLRVAQGATRAEAARTGFAISSAMITASEGGWSEKQMFEDLVAKGVPEKDARPVAARGGVAYGFVSGLIERGILPYQLRGLTSGQQGLRAFVMRVIAGGSGEITEEETQLLTEGLTRYLAGRSVGVDLETGITPRAMIESGLAAGPAGGAISGLAGGARAEPPISPEPDEPLIPITDIDANTPAAARDARRQILGKPGGPTPEEQEVVDVSRADIDDEVLDQLQGLNEQERAVARETFEEIVASGQNPFTDEVMSPEQAAGIAELLQELDTVQEAIPETPSEAFATPEEIPDAEAREEIPPEAEAVDQEDRQEIEEGQKEAAEALATEPEDQAAGTVEEPEPEADTFATTLTEVGQAFPEELAEPLARIETLNRRVDELLDQGLTREADPLIQELEGMKAEVLAELDRLQSVHGQAGGKFAIASRGARAIGNTAQASIERLVDTARTVAGSEDFEASVSPVDPSSPQGGLAREARRIGLNVTYFDSESDAIPAAHDPYGDGRRILVNAALPIDEQTRAVFSHELVHALQMSSEAVWEKFYQRITTIDAKGLEAAGRAYWNLLTEGKGSFQEWFDSDRGRSESVARYVEDRATDADFYNRVVGNDRNLLTIIRDIARRLAEIMGLAGVETKGLLEVSRLADQAAKAFKATKTPVQFVGFQEGTENVPGFNLVNLPAGTTVKFDPAKHQITGIDPAAEQEGVTLPQALAEGVDATEGLITEQVNLALGKPRRPRGRGVKRQVDRVTGVRKGTVSDREAKQLRRILKQQRKVGEQAFREGLSTAQGRVLNMIEGVFGKMGMQVTQRMIERMQKARKARSPEQVVRQGLRLMDDQVRLIRMRMVEDVRQRSVSIRKIKRQITEAVRGNLTGPQGAKLQGRFLGDVAKAETATQLHIAMKRIELAVGQVGFRQAANDLVKVERKAKGFRQMTNDLRRQIEVIIAQAKNAAFRTSVTVKGGERRTLRTFDTRAEYEAAQDDALDAVVEVEQLLANRRLERQEINADEARTIANHIDVLDAHMRGVASATTPGVRIGGLKQLKGRSKTVQDKVTGLKKRGLIALMDIANLSRYAEGQWDQEGVLAALLDRGQKEAESPYNSERRDTADLANRLVQENTGYKNLAEAQMKLQGTLGEANQEFAEVTIAGEQVTLPLDNIGEIVALDERTLAGWAEDGFQIESARQTEPLRPTLTELQDIRIQWADQFGGLSTGIKGHIEALKPRTFKAYESITGKEPLEEPPGYFPSTRNLTAGPDFGLAPDLRSFMRSAARRWAESAGFLQARTGGKSPFVSRGLLRTYLDHVDQSLKIIHLAKPVRDAAAVLLNPRTVQLINQVHGSDMNEILQLHLIEASRMNQDSDGGPDRRLRTLNTNAIATWLATNVGTYFRQIGSVFRIQARMPMKYFLIGMRGLGPGTYAEMKKKSGNFWDRYEGDSYARYSPMRGQGLAGMDFSAFGQSFGALLRSVRSLDRRSAFRSWTALMRSIKLLDWFDAIAARIAWAGRKQQVIDENPSWTEAQVLEETATRAFDDIRSTANTSSVNDSASLAVKWRNTPWRYFLLFTTDPNKSLNFLIRSWHEGPRQGFRASLGVAGNMAWSAYAVTLTLQASADLVASVLGAALGRDPDEEEREKQRIKSWERANLRMLTEVFGLSFFGDELVNAVVAVSQPFRRDDVFRAPIGQVISDAFMGVGQTGFTIWELMRNFEDGLTEEEWDKFTEDLIDGLVRSAKSASTLLGNPLLMPWYRVKPIKEQLFPDDEAAEARQELSPEVR